VNTAARAIIAALALEPLPREGGYFRATWRSATASAIYFLVTPEDFSALHRIAQDEIWHHYAGDAVEHVQLDPRDGSVRTIRLGPDVLSGEEPQLVVTANVWQGAKLAAGPRAGYALLGCTVSPPWDERGFALADPMELRSAFPGQHAAIGALTR